MMDQAIGQFSSLAGPEQALVEIGICFGSGVEANPSRSFSNLNVKRHAAGKYSRKQRDT